MCLSIPGKVVSVSEGRVLVDYSGVKREAKVMLKKPKEGDYVIIQAGRVVEIMDREKAERALKDFEEAEMTFKKEGL